MTLESLWNSIVRDVPTLTEIQELKGDVNRVIREINMKIPGIETTETAVLQVTDNEELTLTFDAAGKTINDDGLGDFTADYGFVAGQKIWFYGTDVLNVIEMTIDSIGNDAATNDQITVTEVIVDDAAIEGTLVGFTVLTNYAWDNVSKELELKAAVKQFIDIFVDDEELTRKDHDIVFDSDYADELYYAKIGRSTIKLTSGIFGGEDATIKIKGLIDIAEISTTTFETVIDIPQQYEVLLEKGILFYLLSRPMHAGGPETTKTKDEATQFYLGAIGDLQRVENDRDVNSIKYPKDYIY